MSRFLEKLDFPNDIKTMSYEDLELLSYEIRDFLIGSVSRTGGHLSSNLGIVEISLAVHRMFDPPQDKLIWDVGHQTYVHKILTGRMDRFPTLRKFKGMSGFPKMLAKPGLGFYSRLITSTPAVGRVCMMVMRLLVPDRSGR